METHRRSEAAIAIIGGSGFGSLFTEAECESITVDTPYGQPSGELQVGEIAGRSTIFLARHGLGHRQPPHLVNYRANIWAFASLGVRALLTQSAVGGLSPATSSDRLVIPDQFIDRTSGRVDSFFGTGLVRHVPMARPYCPILRGALLQAATANGEDPVNGGTIVVIQGPRFATRAESSVYRSWGADIINMTQYPEVALAAELGIGYANLSYVTDRDVGDNDDDPEQVGAEMVFARMNAAQPRLHAIMRAAVAAVPGHYVPTRYIDEDAIAAILAKSPKPVVGSGEEQTRDDHATADTTREGD